MKRIIKITGILFGGLIGLIILTVIALGLFLDPNDYKDKIAASASKSIGHDVVLRGPLSASFFPWLGLTAEDVVVNARNKVSAETLATIGELNLRVQTLALLRDQVNIDTIKIKDVNIHLERNAAGKTNWEASQTEVPNQTSEASAETTTSPDGEKPKGSKMRFEVSGVEVTNANLTYMDQKSSQKFKLSDLRFTTGEIKKGEPTPIDGHFSLHLADKSEQLNNTTDFSGTLNYGLTGFKLSDVVLNTEMESKSLPVNPLQAKLKGNITGDLLSAKISFEDVVLDVDKSRATGKGSFTWLKQPHVDFDVDVDKIDLARYMAQTNTASTQMVAHQDDTVWLSPESNIAYVAYEPKTSLSYLGNVRVGELKARGLTFTEVKLTAKNHDQGVLLNPLSTRFYSGQFNGESMVNFKNQSSSLKGNASQINVGDLLKAVSGSAHLTGSGDAKLNVLVDKTGLNGTIDLKVAKGDIHGVDIDYYLKTARVQLKQLQQFIGDASLDDFSADKTKDRKKTDYEQITATILANANVLTNDNLNLLANDFTAVGSGSIDLNQEFINYKFTANRKYTDNKDHSHALPLSVRVKGPFNNIQVIPDIDAYIQAVIKEELKSKAEGEISKQLDKALGGSGDGNKSVEEVIENKVEDEIKKLFKF